MILKKLFKKYNRIVLKSFIYLLIFHALDFCVSKAFELPAFQVFSIQNLVASDFTYNDLFYRAQGKAGFKDVKRKHKEEIILVNTAELDGEEFRLNLANLLDSIEKFNPKAVGIDFTFSMDTSITGTPELLEVSERYRNLVLAQSNEANYLSYSAKVTRGNVDFPLEQFSIRYYQGGDKSFAFKLFNKVRGVKETPVFCSRDSFPIVYSCVHDGMVSYEEKMNDNYEVNYKTIAGEKLLENPAEYSSAIKNNIIIIGHLGRNQFDMEDRFPVPTDTNDVVNRVPLMPGPVIHANALSNMLDNQYFTTPNNWLSFLLYNIIMLILIFFIIQHSMKILLIGGLVIISIIWIWLSIYIMEFKIYIQVGSTLVGLLILEEFIEVFDPFVVNWYAKLKKSLSKIKK